MSNNPNPRNDPDPPPPLSRLVWVIIIGGSILIFIGCYVMYRISGTGQSY